MAISLQDIQLRPMTEGDIEQAVALTRAEGWPHRADDWAFHLSLGTGWVLASPDDELLGTLLWWEFGHQVATLGLIVVNQSYQGQGLGRRLMEVARQALGERTLRLVSTDAGYKLYQHFGFQPVIPVEQRQAHLSGVKPLPLGPREEIRPVIPSDAEQIYSLDQQAFGADRQRLLHKLLETGECLVLQQSGRFSGFAMIRTSGKGSVVGPVVAGDQSEAKALVSHLLADREIFCRIDVPRKAGALATWLDETGLPVVDQVTAMQNHSAPMSKASQFHTYSLVSQALG